MVTLNCLVYESRPALSRIFPVEVDPSKTVGVLRKKIWEENAELRTNANSSRLDLYTPKTPISTASKEEFKHVFAGMNLRTPGGRNSALEELNPTRKLENYDGLFKPDEEVLHIIVFLSEGRRR
jgi:Crinkler effector protein N-terminal domain